MSKATNNLDRLLSDYRASCVHTPYIQVDESKYYAYVNVDIKSGQITRVDFHSDRPDSKVTPQTCYAIECWMLENGMTETLIHN